MKNKKNGQNNIKGNHPPIPDIDIIDLEDPASSDQLTTAAPHHALAVPAGTDSALPQKGRKTGFPRINIHIVLLIVFLLFIAGILYKFFNFGERVDLDEIFRDGPGTVDDTFDTILPLTDANGNPLYQIYGEGSTILAFGNAPFADDRNSEDNLANLIQQMTGATVYNCSVGGSYLAAEAEDLDPAAHPWDIFNFYWLCDLATGFHQDIPDKFMQGMEVLGEQAPPEAMEVYNTLTTIDMNDVDVIVAMYDASDYLAGHEMYNDGNNTDLLQFTGNMEAGIELLRFCYPNIRIIILSPTYAYGLDEDGNYVSSDIQRYGWDVLSTYSIKQYASCASKSVTFVDNLYGTITEDNAEDYLIDHLHLNVEGRKKVAQRFVDALNYFEHMVGSETPLPE